MASTGYLLTFLNTLPNDVKRPLSALVQEAFKTLRFGAADEAAAACENFGGHLVPVTTSATADQEVAVAHGLGRTPRLMFPVLAPNTVNATIPVIEVTKAADSVYFYVASATQSASFHMYLE